tara:strand:- start:802 stop:915 length:114 start_codon:yes stop_codon:yes gene_type:complete
MIKGLIKGIAYTVGFVALGSIGVAVVGYLEHGDYKPE